MSAPGKLELLACLLWFLIQILLPPSTVLSFSGTRMVALMNGFAIEAFSSMEGGCAGPKIWLPSHSYHLTEKAAWADLHVRLTDLGVLGPAEENLLG